MKKAVLAVVTGLLLVNAGLLLSAKPKKEPVKKETEVQKTSDGNYIIGKYVVYTDENNIVEDITTFTKEVQVWGKKYKGYKLEDVMTLINQGIDLKGDVKLNR